jgi:hypothetical protein
VPDRRVATGLARALIGRALVTALATALTTAPSRALGYDAQVRAETYLQAYQLRGPAGAPLITSRRITQTLALDLVDRPVDPRGVTVSFRMRLRFDADFGEACDAVTDRCLAETNRDRSAEFQPLFTTRSMDIPFAYLDLAGIGHGTLDFRIGRIFQVDPLGFFVFDGARARLHLGDIAIAEALLGLETRAGFAASNGRFERDGLIRGDRTGWDPSVAPFVVHRELAPVFGASVETAWIEPVYARVSYRRVWTPSGIAEEKVGAQLDGRFGRSIRGYANVVYSVPQQTVSFATANLEWFTRRGSHLGLEYSRFRPTFDLTSIWASFWIDGTDEARLHSELALNPQLSLSTALYARRYALSEADPGGAQSDLWNTGVTAAIHTRRPAWHGALRGNVEGGSVGPRAGLDADGFWWAVPGFLRLDARLSFWHVDDELRPQRSGFSFGGVVGGTVRLGSIADLHLNLEDDVNRLVGHRVRVMAILSVRGLL